MPTLECKCIFCSSCGSRKSNSSNITFLFTDESVKPRLMEKNVFPSDFIQDVTSSTWLGKPEFIKLRLLLMYLKSSEMVDLLLCSITAGSFLFRWFMTPKTGTPVYDSISLRSVILLLNRDLPYRKAIGA